jgi:hypothetical protein
MDQMGNNTSEKKAFWVKFKKTSGWGVLSFSGISHKGCITKIQRGRLTREQMHHLPFHQMASGYNFKRLFLRVHCKLTY